MAHFYYWSGMVTDPLVFPEGYIVTLASDELELTEDDREFLASIKVKV